jgi:hypothetical protein
MPFNDIGVAVPFIISLSNHLALDVRLGVEPRVQPVQLEAQRDAWVCRFNKIAFDFRCHSRPCAGQAVVDGMDWRGALLHRLRAFGLAGDYFKYLDRFYINL